MKSYPLSTSTKGGINVEGSDADSVTSTSSIIKSKATTHLIAAIAADVSTTALDNDNHPRMEILRAPSTRILSDVKISIRMRIHSSWKKTKFVSLEAFRLGFIDDVHNNNNNNHRPSMLWIDLRPFTVKISSGMQLLSSTSEAVRSIESLIHGNGSRAGSTRSPSQCWKGMLHILLHCLLIL